MNCLFSPQFSIKILKNNQQPLLWSTIYSFKTESLKQRPFSRIFPLLLEICINFNMIILIASSICLMEPVIIIKSQESYQQNILNTLSWHGGNYSKKYMISSINHKKLRVMAVLKDKKLHSQLQLLIMVLKLRSIDLLKEK